MKQARKLALCGLLTALASVILVLGGMIPLATFCAPMLAMAVLLPVTDEFGSRWTVAAWLATATLGLLLSADRELALVYLFFGWYPAVRPRIDALPGRLLPILCRVGVCTGVTAVLYGVVIRFLGLGDETPATAGLAVLLLICSNAVFLLGDRLLRQLTLVWRYRLRRRFFHE